MSWRRVPSRSRCEFWSTSKLTQEWRWTFFCPRLLVLDVQCGRVSWHCCPKTSSTKAAGASPWVKTRTITYQVISAKNVFGAYCPLTVAALDLIFIHREGHPIAITCIAADPLVLTGQADETRPENMKQVELRVPRSPSLQCVWSSSDRSPYGFLSLPPWFCDYRSQIPPSLWMLSVCLAEIEKNKGIQTYVEKFNGVVFGCPRQTSWPSVMSPGVEVITAPVSITAQFKEPLLVPGKVMIKFWETDKNGDQSPSQGISFHMEQHGNKISVVGRISKSWLTLSCVYICNVV